MIGHGRTRMRMRKLETSPTDNGGLLNEPTPRKELVGKSKPKIGVRSRWMYRPVMMSGGALKKGIRKEPTDPHRHQNQSKRPRKRNSNAEKEKGPYT